MAQDSNPFARKWFIDEPVRCGLVDGGDHWLVRLREDRRGASQKLIVEVLIPYRAGRAAAKKAGQRVFDALFGRRATRG